jgi:hypothetical protein
MGLQLILGVLIMIVAAFVTVFVFVSPDFSKSFLVHFPSLTVSDSYDNPVPNYKGAAVIGLIAAVLLGFVYAILMAL